MTVRTAALVAMLGACRLQAPTPPADEVHHGDGWSLRIPAGARVEVSPMSVRVDSADGASWFDIQLGTAGDPSTLATSWAQPTCIPVRWDQHAEPLPGLWFSGGTCTIGYRHFWVITVIETRGDRSLLTAMVSRHGAQGYEDVWHDMLHDALSLSTTSPAQWIDEAELRRRIRAIPPDDGTRDQLPLPGGGTFSAKVSAALTDVWTARQGAPWPERFVP